MTDRSRGRAMTDDVLISPALVRLEWEPRDRDEVLAEVGGALVQAGCARPSLPAALAERERTHPTGLAARVGLALPHADATHVLRSALFVGVLATPVAFADMVEASGTVDVRVVLGLAIADASQHAAWLGVLMRAVAGEALLPGLLACDDAGQAVAVVREALDDATPRNA